MVDNPAAKVNIPVNMCLECIFFWVHLQDMWLRESQAKYDNPIKCCVHCGALSLLWGLWPRCTPHLYKGVHIIPNTWLTSAKYRSFTDVRYRTPHLHIFQRDNRECRWLSCLYTNLLKNDNGNANLFLLTEQEVIRRYCQLNADCTAVLFTSISTVTVQHRVLIHLNTATCNLKFANEQNFYLKGGWVDNTATSNQNMSLAHFLVEVANYHGALPSLQAPQNVQKYLEYQLGTTHELKVMQIAWRHKKKRNKTKTVQ